MWQYYGLIALTLANERAREAREQAERWRLVSDAEASSDGAGTGTRRRTVRTVVAWPVRAFSDATHALSDAACDAATRIEGRTA